MFELSQKVKLLTSHLDLRRLFTSVALLFSASFRPTMPLIIIWFSEVLLVVAKFMMSFEMSSGVLSVRKLFVPTWSRITSGLFFKDGFM